MGEIWVRRLQLTAEDRVFAGAEATAMRNALAATDFCATHGVSTQRVSLSDQAALAGRLRGTCGDAVASQITARFGLCDFGDAGLAVLTSSRLRSAIDAANAYAPLLNLRHPISLSFRDEQAILSFRSHAFIDHDVRAALLPLDVAKVCRFLQDLFDGDDGAVGCLTPAAFADDPDGEAIVAEIRLPAQVAQRKLPNASRAANQAHHAASRRRMQGLEDGALLRAVRRLLLRAYGELPTLVEAAGQLGYSTRTFRRRLSEHGTTFITILDELRFAWAVYFLEERRMTTEAIAEKLGYSESANFRHAFRRWTGSSVRRYSPDAPPAANSRWRIDARLIDMSFELCRPTWRRAETVLQPEPIVLERPSPPPPLFGQPAPCPELLSA